MLEKRLFLAGEFVVLFIGLPLVLLFQPSRLNAAIALWGVCIYGLVWCRRQPNFSWRNLWHGVGWSARHKRVAFGRYCISLPLLFLLAWHLAPNSLFSFPLERPRFWLIVMLLYPILSALPQEFLFRSFFFRRYQQLFSAPLLMIAASAIGFSFIHVIFRNFVAPSLCLIGGVIFAVSYSQHRALKWAMIEHAAYGCTLFTIGLGSYFVMSAIRP